MGTDERPRGVIGYRMPEEVCGPIDRYALFFRRSAEHGVEIRMVHYEGVAYSVTREKPWKWTDFAPDAPSWNMAELMALASDTEAVDLADWVRTFGARLESNFAQIYDWATEYEEDETLGSCGCTDYHMADCPLVTSRREAQDEPDQDDWYDQD